MTMELIKREDARPVAIVNPATGVLVALTDATDQLAEAQEGCDQMTAEIREAKKLLSEELVRRLDKAARWTHHVGGLTISAPSPHAGTKEVNKERLVAALRELLEQDLIDQEAADAACRIEVTIDVGVTSPRADQEGAVIKAKKGGIDRLEKLGGEVAEAIAGCYDEVDPPKRTATVKRKAAR